MSSSTSSRPSRPPTHHLEVFTESSFVKDVAKALLHTLFFQRLFPAVRPLTRDIAFTPPASSAATTTTTRIHATPSYAQHSPPYAPEPPTITHPLVDDPDLESIITDRATQLAKTLERFQRADPSADVKGTVAVHFHERKRKKAATGFAGFWKEPSGGGEVNGVCWESWEIQFTVQKARAGQRRRYEGDEDESEEEEVAGNAQALARKSVKSLRRAIMAVVALAGEEKEHIPPITSAENNPFPYEIVVRTGK